jgi:hypothetical protein
MQKRDDSKKKLHIEKRIGGGRERRREAGRAIETMNGKGLETSGKAGKR